MLNRNDPLIGAVQEVMRKNQAERDAVKAVNEKFGVVDRRALPREQQANWDAAYNKVISEGVEVLNEELSPKQKQLAAVAGNKKKIDAPDLAAARAGKASHIKEEDLEEKAKWRSTSVAKKVTSPDDPDSISYDYHHDNPRSTGAMRATSDKPNSYDGLNNRRKSDVVSRGERKGKITRDSANRLKDRIVGNHFQKEEKIDEVAPPGREKQVKELKKKFPKKSAFAIAWASYNKKKGK